MPRLNGWAGRLLLGLLSAAAILGSAYYVGRMLLDLWRYPGGVVLTADLAVAVLAGAAAYAALHLPLGAAWGVLVSAAMSARAPARAIASVYGRSQIAKYLPSNVVHFAGRQLLGGRLGWPQAAIAASSLLETALLVLAAVCGMLAFGALLSERAFELVPAPLLWGAAAATLIGFVTARRLALGWGWLRRRVQGHIALDALASGRAVALAFLLYAVFFIGGGVICHILLASLDPAWTWRRAPWSILAFSAAWLAGFVVPGAPGGLGVREAALAYLLSDGVGEHAAVVTALLLRAVTVLGDVLCFLVCVGLSPASARPSA
jgi:uncharacterized membrane protein YbhN (UPF0104 family)